MKHTSINNEPEEDRCDCIETNQIPFLDTLISIKKGKIDIDLYKKESDRNQYLLPTSCHSKNTTKAIPYSLSLRIVRICTDPTNREKRFQELKQRLIERGYSEKVIDSAISKARKVPRKIALRKALKPSQSEGPIFAVTFDPRLPSLGNIMAKHWRSMVSRNKYLEEVFKRPPLIAYKRQQNLRGHLVRAKVAPSKGPYPKRKLVGMKKCGESCTACSYIKECKSVKINGIDWKIKRQLNCKCYNIVYAILCTKENCKQTYIGETKRLLRVCLDNRRGYVNNFIHNATGTHFNQPGHTLANIQIVALEQIRKNSDLYRKEREEYFIRKFNTVMKGLNRKY